MKVYRKWVGFLSAAGVLLTPFVIAAITPEHQGAAVTSAESYNFTSQEAEGRYLVMIGGCNDCHTHGFAQALGKIPISDWLAGDTTGWWGPWGTTYPANLRILIPAMSEDEWVKFAGQVKTRPPMAWWVLNEMHEQDLRAMHRFIARLGTRSDATPAALPADRKPPVPYVQFVLQAAPANP
jgi:hypothetical protein